MKNTAEKIEILRGEFHKVAEDVDWEKIEDAEIFVLTRTKRALCEALERLIDQESDKNIEGKKMKATKFTQTMTGLNVELENLEKAISEINEWDMTNRASECGKTEVVARGILPVEFDEMLIEECCETSGEVEIILEMKDDEELSDYQIYDIERVISVKLI